MAVGDADEAKKLVYAWMENVGYSPKEIPNPENLEFLIQGAGPTNIPVAVIRPSEAKAKFIVVVVNVNISESSYKSLSAMSEKDREEFLWNLKRDLVFAPASFSFLEDKDTGILKRAQFSKPVYFEELTESRLAEVIDYTVRSALWLIWTFGKRFGPPSEVKQSVD